MYFTKDELTLALKRGRIFNHFKGNQYILLHYAADHTNGKSDVTPVIVYANLDPLDTMVFVRNAHEFFSPVDKDKYPGETQELRFEVAEELFLEKYDAYCNS